ncbi:beta-ketoacyl-[acyl-carrier-protein] synthase family protein [Planctomycetes bacterium K23_9]|uniref:3-oxoacyl-[acyl-carrier-protein] synthase 2 n=1 Tax=Stieleria marina TaxID=1930275 RepID=A0A517NY94_9BACT|nr:3-oxoacyl-[acyl-carrier-protein] synthase 2 [Planctomycetes bacterium K23_9]
MDNSSDLNSKARVVITGVGVVSPFGNDANELVDALRTRKSAVGKLQTLPQDVLCTNHGAEALSFTGHIDNYGPMDKKLQRTIRKGSKLMCREIEMGVACAQLALNDAELTLENRDKFRTGVIYGTDYIMSRPEEFERAFIKVMEEDGQFHFDKWGQIGKPEVSPLWLLKYLPNMPASHVAIYNDLQGPNNSLTLREASGGAAIAEVVSMIRRGIADIMIAGSTGTRIHPLRSLHATKQESIAADRDDPATMSRPFNADRDGSVIGEGAAAIVCESLAHAQDRGANILGEIVGYGTSSVGVNASSHSLKQAATNVLRSVLRGGDPKAVGHIHAHGLGTVDMDQQESEAIVEVFGNASEQPLVTTAKGHFGNLGAGSGMVEIVASLKSLGGELFPILNCDSPDPKCNLNLCTESAPAGDEFVSINVTPQGQASGVRVQKFVA